jgi:phosphate uptake regulator
VAKAAARGGDYGKNIFDLAEITARPPEGKQREALVQLKDRISEMMANCREVFDSSEKEAAKQLIVEAKQVEDLCDEHVRNLVREAAPDPMSPAYVLAYRYFKRVTAHLRNVASSVVQPVHKLDFTSKITAEGAAEDTSEKAAKEDEEG